MFKIKNKWVVLLGALLAQISIGSIYSWSLFNAPIAEALQVDSTEIVTTFLIAIFFFAFATLISGPLQLKKGPKVTALIGAALYAGGVFLSAFATSPQMLYLTYGAISGMGVGFVYVVPLATLVKWFPKKKGTITGIAVGTFAAGSIFFKYIIKYFLDQGPATPELIQATFIKLAVIYLIMGGIGALLIDAPEVKASAKSLNDGDYRPKKMISTKNFVILFLAFLLTTMPGILTIGIAKDIATDLVGLEYAVAAGIVAWVAVFNASGRMISGVLADKIGALNVIKITSIMSVAGLAMFTFMDLNYFTFVIAILAVVAGYGSFLAIFPNLVASMFGSSYYSANYGIVYQGYGLAALVGPIVLKNSSGFTQTFMISMIIAIAGVIVLNLLKPQPKNVETNEVELKNQRA